MLKNLSLFLFTTLLLNSTAQAVVVTTPVSDPCSDMFNYKDEVYVCADHPVYGKELHRINGGRYSTIVVKDIDSGPGGSGPRAFFESNGWLYFFAETTATGYALWRTDGTEAGTKLIRSIFGHEAVRVVANIGSDFFIIVSKDDEGNLIRTDGTYDGTQLIQADVEPSEFDDTSYIALDNSLYFETDNTLYKVAENNTVSIVYEAFPADLRGDVYVLIYDQLFDGKMVIRVNGEIWLSDGTTSGTVPFIKVNGVSVTSARVANDHLLYIYDSNSGREEVLRSTDGVTDVRLTNTGVIPTSFSAYGTTIIANRAIYNNSIGSGSDRRRRLVFTGGTVETTKFYEVDRFIRGFTLYDGFAYLSEEGKIIKINPTTGSKQELVNHELVNLGDRLAIRDVDLRGVLYSVCIGRSDYCELWLLSANGGATKLGDLPDRALSGSVHTEGGRSYLGGLLLNVGIWHTNGTPTSTYRLSYRYDNGEPEPDPSENVILVPIIDLLMDEEESVQP